MKIELKRLKIALHMSEETTAFTADIFVDGTKAGYAKNDGHGGSTFYQFYGGKRDLRDLIEKAEKFCKTLPPTKFPAVKGMDAFKIPMDLESYINQLVEDDLKQKDQKKLERKMESAIMWGIPNSNSYAVVKFNKPLSEMPTLQLQVYVNKYKKDFKQGEVFLNTNLKSLGINL